MTTGAVHAGGTTDPSQLPGLTGWVASVMEAMEEPGVGLLTALETVFPPIPSEVVLPLGGFLTRQGGFSLPLVLLSATLGSVLGALALYGLGAWLGRERATAVLSRVPLVDREDVERASAWFDRHGRAAVFFGRLVPGVRSLISLPAGANGMPLVQFTAYTTGGSLVWNTLLVGAGVLLGDRWDQVEQYSSWLDRALIAALVGVVGWAVWRRVRARRSVDA
jgi:membrane protein DedA with SNARE-associated domain